MGEGEGAGEKRDDDSADAPHESELATPEGNKAEEAQPLSVDSQAIAKALEGVRSFDSQTIAKALEGVRSFDSQAIAKALEGAYRVPEKLVPETALDDEAEDPEAERVEDESEQVPAALSELLELLRSSGVTAELVGDAPHLLAVRFDLPAGRSTRPVLVRHAQAQVLLGHDVRSWRSLQRYDGIWSESEEAIEIAVRGDRLGPPARMLLERLTGTGHDADGETPLRYQVTDDESGVRLTIGEASEIASVLLSSRRPLRTPTTLRLDHIRVSTSDYADRVAEQVGDAVSFGLHLNLGMSLVLQRLENRETLLRRRRLQVGGSFSFPKNRYPHAPVLLYQAGRERTTSPLIRYWAFYQVLEYFFPRFSRLEAVRTLSRHLRTPTFDAHREEDVLKILDLAASTGAGSNSEADHLLVTVQAIVSPNEILDLITELDLRQQVTDSRSELSSRTLTLRPHAALHSELSQRIYDIRCRIVHSKSASQRETGPGLLPGTHHDDLVASELPLIEYLAQQALVSAAEQLRLP